MKTITEIKKDLARMYSIMTAAQGCAPEKSEKGYAKASSALLAGKRLLANQDGGSVNVFDTDGLLVMSATKRDWVWRENDANALERHREREEISGRRRREYSLTDEEDKAVKRLIAEMRET